MTPVDRDQRWRKLNCQGGTIWLTGLPGAGKSTVGIGLEWALLERQHRTYRLDGDIMRGGLNQDLGFSDADRTENQRRLAEVSALFADSGAKVVVATISPRATHREHVRAIHARRGLPFLEVYVATPVEVCAARDPKGLYEKARTGKLTGLTGIDAPYEAPESHDLVLDTSNETAEASIERCLALLTDRGWLS